MSASTANQSMNRAKKAVTGPSKTKSSGSKSTSSGNGIEFVNTGASTDAAGHVYQSGKATSGTHSQTQAPATINKDNKYINQTANGAIRNAAVDSAAENKKSYDQNDIKTYGNRETAYTFRDKDTGKLNTVYSNLTNYQDAAKAAGYNMADEGKYWTLDNATTYGISGSSGRGTTYGSSAGNYVHSQPASGGWYGEAGRAINNAHNKYGGLENTVNNQFGDQWKEYMVNNYLPVYGKNVDEVNWEDVASGAAAQAYHDTLEGWTDSLLGNNQSQGAGSYKDALAAYTSWKPFSMNGSGGASGNGGGGAGGYGSSGLQALSLPTNGNGGLTSLQRLNPLSYQGPVGQGQNAIKPLAYQSGGVSASPAALAYGNAGARNTDANIAMAQYFAQQAANARDEQTRRNALTMALKYRQTL